MYVYVCILYIVADKRFLLIVLAIARIGHILWILLLFIFLLISLSFYLVRLSNASISTLISAIQMWRTTKFFTINVWKISCKLKYRPCEEKQRE